MFGALMSQRVVLKRPQYGNTDRYGNDAPTFHEQEHWIEAWAYVQPVNSVEEQADMNRRVSEYTLLVGPQTELEADFRVEVDGRDFEVIGEPQVFRTPRGVHHVEATIRIVEG